MYAFIEGYLDSIEDFNIVVVTNGVGYEITCANPFQFESLKNEKIRIYTYHYVREDQQLLFGFKKQEEKQFFAKLLNVSGIGPKSALSIVGTSAVGQIAAAIEQEDEKFLTSFPGVGKKTARQMILDLKGKVTEWIDTSLNNDQVSGEKNNKINKNQELMDEALEALRSLGYSEREIQRITPKLRQHEGFTVDEFIKKSLSLMMER